jgi:hypothetical protein
MGFKDRKSGVVDILRVATKLLILDIELCLLRNLAKNLSLGFLLTESFSTRLNSGKGVITTREIVNFLVKIECEIVFTVLEVVVTSFDTLSIDL